MNQSISRHFYKILVRKFYHPLSIGQTLLSLHFHIHGLRIFSHFQNSYQSTKLIGYPNLPMLNQLIEVPHNANIRIEIIEDNTTTYDLINYGITSNIIPIQPSLSKSDNLNNIIFHKDQEIYSNNLYKKELIKVENKGLLRQVRITNLMISPIEYNPIENKIIVHENIKIRLHFDNANFDLTNEKKIQYYSPYFEPIFNQFLPNYINPIHETRNNNFITDVVSYLIILIYWDIYIPFFCIINSIIISSVSMPNNTNTGIVCQYT